MIQRIFECRVIETSHFFYEGVAKATQIAKNILACSAKSVLLCCASMYMYSATFQLCSDPHFFKQESILSSFEEA